MMILVVEPGKTPEARDISGSLKEMQSIVGGYIEAIHPFDDPDVVLVCNEEGKFMDVLPNRALRDKNGQMCDIVFGTFFLCGAPADCDHFTSLTPEQIMEYEKHFHTPEAFVGSNGRIICIPFPAGTFS